MKEKKAQPALDAFGTLREGTEQAQVNASIEILNNLVKKQQILGTDECCYEVSLGVRRIIRGLGSPRSRARRGFYATFVGLLKSFPSLSMQIYCDAIDKELKGDESDVLKGQVVAYGALVESGAIFKANTEQLKKITTTILSIGQRKIYLRLAVHTFLVDLIKNIDVDRVGIVWTLVHEKYIRNVTEFTLETYHLLLIAQYKFPAIVNEQYLNKFLGAPEILNTKTIDEIAIQLLAVPHVSYIKSPMYQDILNCLIARKKIMKMFWEVVNEFLTAQTPQTMSLALKLFSWMAVQTKDKNLMKYALTTNLIMIIENTQNIASVEEARQEAIDKFAESIIKNGSLKPKTVISVVQNLYFYPGSFQLFIGHSSKIFKSLMNNFNEETSQEVAKLCSDILTDKSTRTIDVKEKNSHKTVNRPWKESHKYTSVNMLTTLICHPSNSSVAWKIEQLKIVIGIGFFSKGVSPKLAAAARKSFYTALDQKFARLIDLRSYLTGLATHFDEKLSGNDYFAIDFTAEMRKEWSKMMKIVTSLEKSKTDSGKLANTTFNIMFLSLGFMLFKDPESSIKNLKELRSIYKHLNLEPLEGSDEPRWTDVTVDLVLSLLSQSNKFNRHIITKIFIYLCPHLSSDNIHQILKVLNPNSYNPLVETNGQGNSIGEEEEEEDDEDGSDSGEDSDESDIDMSEDDAEDEGTECDRLRVLVRDALGNAAALTDTESIDVDDLEEEEGRKLDEKLSEAFRTMKQQQTRKQTLEDKDLSDFRLRALDLLEIWIKTKPDLSVLLDVIVTVLMLLENTVKASKKNLELENRLKTFIKRVTSINKYTVSEEFDNMQIVQLIEKITSKEDRSNSVLVSMSTETVECCTYLLKISMKDIKKIKKVRKNILEVYRKLLNDCLSTKNSSTPIGLFQSALELVWEGGISLVEDISSCVYGLRPFQMCQGLRLLNGFFRNKRLLETELGQNNDKLVEIARKIIDDGLIELKKNSTPSLLNQFLQTKDAIKKSGLKEVANWQSVESDLKELKDGLAKRPSTENGSNKPKKKQKLQNGNAGTEINGTEEDGEEVVTNQTASSNQAKKKKKKKINTREISKKTIKLRRAKESSKGLDETFSFSRISTGAKFLDVN